MTKKKAGRPVGSKDPNLVERVSKRLPKIYEAQLRAAENGDTDAARFCVDIVTNPDKFPDNGKQPT